VNKLKLIKQCQSCGLDLLKHNAKQLLECHKKLDMTTLYLRSVPTRLKRKFKMKCADEGITMTEKMLELMRSAVEI
jgi:hypothetical protein